MKIDVVIPIYNAENFLEETISSVASQTYPVNQIILINDGSTDSSHNIIERLSNRYTNIKTYEQKNSGPSAARNKGILNSSAELIALLDADDVWEKNKLELQISCFLKNRNLGVAYCAYNVIDEQSNPYRNETPLQPKLQGSIYDKLIFGNQISGCDSAVLIRKECLNQCGLFDESLPYGEDWDLWLRIASQFEFDFIPQSLVKIRRYPNSHSSRLKNQDLKFNLQVLNKQLTLFPQKEHLIHQSLESMLVNTTDNWVNQLLFGSSIRQMIPSSFARLLLLAKTLKRRF